MTHHILQRHDARNRVEDRIDPEIIKRFASVAFRPGDGNHRNIPDFFCAFRDTDRNFSQRGLEVNPSFARNYKVRLLHMLIEIREIQNQVDSRADRHREIRENSAEQAACRSAPVGVGGSAVEFILQNCGIVSERRVKNLHLLLISPFLRSEHGSCSEGSAEVIFYIAGNQKLASGGFPQKPIRGYRGKFP